MNDHASSALTSKRYQAGERMSLAADVGGDPSSSPVILLHGGGQTRFSWGGAAQELINNGCHVISLDLRGHGESDWAADANYSIDGFCDDLRAVMSALDRPPILIGASLGGLVSLTTTGESPTGAVRALVLVDVTPTVDPEGRERIIGFMRGRPDGFASLEEAADAIAVYLPHRPRPKSLGGLNRNLRKREDGRWYWHWDPRLFDTFEEDAERAEERYARAAENVSVPTLLVRGSESELVKSQHVEHLMKAIRHAEYIDVLGATHMIAGDRNDVFNAVIVDFVSRTLRAQERA